MMKLNILYFRVIWPKNKNIFIDIIKEHQTFQMFTISSKRVNIFWKILFALKIIIKIFDENYKYLKYRFCYLNIHMTWMTRKKYTVNYQMKVDKHV